MITPSEFIQRWGEYHNKGSLTRFPASGTKDLNIAESDLKFLTVAGLPRSTIAFHLGEILTFGPSESSRLPTATAVLGLPLEFARYRVIGRDAWGDLFCLNTEEPGVFVLHRYDDDFPDGEWRIMFVNSSVPQLAECLLTYEESARREGEEAFFICPDISDETKEWLLQEIWKIDEPAFKEGHFWGEELSLRLNLEYT